MPRFCEAPRVVSEGLSLRLVVQKLDEDVGKLPCVRHAEGAFVVHGQRGCANVVDMGSDHDRPDQLDAQTRTITTPLAASHCLTSSQPVGSRRCQPSRAAFETTTHGRPSRRTRSTSRARSVLGSRFAGSLSPRGWLETSSPWTLGRSFGNGRTQVRYHELLPVAARTCRKGRLQTSKCYTDDLALLRLHHMQETD